MTHGLILLILATTVGIAFYAIRRNKLRADAANTPGPVECAELYLAHEERG